MSIRELRGGQLRFLSDEDLRQIHSAVLEVLGEVGVNV